MVRQSIVSKTNEIVAIMCCTGACSITHGASVTKDGLDIVA